MKESFSGLADGLCHTAHGLQIIRRLPLLLFTRIVAALSEPQRYPKSSEGISSNRQIAMYEVPVAVLLISTCVGLARGSNISPNSNLLLNDNRLAAERLDWRTPLSIKDDPFIMLDVCGTVKYNRNTLTC
jgi:hypothetical protein